MLVTFDVSGRNVNGYLAIPAAGKGVGVMVLHAWWGLTPTFTEVCDRLAAEGFVAFAPDLYEGQIAATIDEAIAIKKQEDQQRTGDVAMAAVKYFAEHPTVTSSDLGVVGFSMGAAWAVVLATRAAQHTAAVVLFYGSYAVDFTSARAAFSGHFAEVDEWEPAEDVLAMEKALHDAGREVTLYTYSGVGHWFFEQDRSAFNAPAAQLAWERTLTFLRQKLS